MLPAINALDPSGQLNNPLPVFEMVPTGAYLQNNMPPTEIDISSSPVAIPTTSPENRQDDSGAFFANSPSVTILKRSHPINLELGLQIDRTNVNMDGLVRDMDELLEDYFFRELSAVLEVDNKLNVRDVNLETGSGNTRRQLLRSNLPLAPSGQPQTGQVLQRTLQQGNVVEIFSKGGVSYDMDSTGDIDQVTQNFDQEIARLLEVGKMNQLMQDAGITNDDIVSSTRMVSGEASEDSGSIRETNSAAEITGPKDKAPITRPSTLSIIFGFILTALAVLGLVAYAFIYCRKRRKRLRRQKQREQSITYQAAPIKPIATKRLPVPPRATMAPRTLNIDEDDSECSSYKGLDSLSDSQAQSDAFARELRQAASLDEMAWNDFQQKKEALDRNDVLKASDVTRSMKPTPAIAKTAPKDEISGKRWGKSFPYGDEPGQPTSTNYDPAQSRRPSRARNQREAPNRTRQLMPVQRGEEKKDDPMAFPRNHVANIESMERTLSQYGHSDEEGEEDESTTPSRSISEAMMEVARLSSFMRKYEKRKERRIQREQESRSVVFSRSFDTASEGRNSSVENTDPEGIRGSNVFKSNLHRQSDMMRGTSPLQSHASPLQSQVAPLQSQTPNNHSSYVNNSRSTAGKARYIDATGMITNYKGPTDIDQAFDTLSDDLVSVSDDEFSPQEEEGSLRSHQRLGITPFTVQKPVDRSYENAMSPMMQKLAKSENLRSREQARTDNFSLPTDERRVDRTRVQNSDNDRATSRRTLKNLRNNSAIVDSSNSDVNVAWDNDAARVATQIRMPKPRTTTAAPPPPQAQSRVAGPPVQPHSNSSNTGFNKLRNLFEAKPKRAIYPPNEHWQLGGGK